MRNVRQIGTDFIIFQDQLLGKGSTGDVYYGESLKYPGKKYAVKAIDMSEINNEVTKYLLQCQITALSQLAKENSQNIVKLQAFHQSKQYCYLIMELLQGGPLSDYIKSRPQGLNQKQALSIFRQLFEAYKHLKRLNIVHRDIKPDNLIFRNEFSVKNQKGPNKLENQKIIVFIDFGYCTMQKVKNKPNAYYNVGSPKYMSPQAYLQNQYSQKSDIWALGIILYQLIHGKTIDSGMEMQEYLAFMRNNPIPIKKQINPLLCSLLLGMLSFDPRKRLNCQKLQQILIQADILLQQYNRGRNIQKIQPQNMSFYRNQHSIERSIDPRRQFRDFSHENLIKQYNSSPKKIIHLQNLPTHNFKPIQTKTEHIQFSNMKQPSHIQKNLQNIIEEENENQTSRNHKAFFFDHSNRKKPSNFDVNPSFTLNQAIAQPSKFLQNQITIKRPDKNSELFRSDILKFSAENMPRNKNVFFTSQVNDSPYENQKHQFQQPNNLPIPKSQIFNSVLNKSMSSNCIQLSEQKNKILSYFQQKKNQNDYFRRPFDHIIRANLKQDDQKMLRSTMPVFRPSIQQLGGNIFIPQNILTKDIQEQKVKMTQNQSYPSPLTLNQPIQFNNVQKNSFNRNQRVINTPFNLQIAQRNMVRQRISSFRNIPLQQRVIQFPSKPNEDYQIRQQIAFKPQNFVNFQRQQKPNRQMQRNSTQINQTAFKTIPSQLRSPQIQFQPRAVLVNQVNLHQEQIKKSYMSNTAIQNRVPQFILMNSQKLQQSRQHNQFLPQARLSHLTPHQMHPNAIPFY